MKRVHLQLSVPVDAVFPKPADSLEALFVSLSDDAQTIEFVDPETVTTANVRNVYVALGTRKPRGRTLDKDFVDPPHHRISHRRFVEDLLAITPRAASLLPFVKKYGPMTWRLGNACYPADSPSAKNVERRYPKAYGCVATPTGELNVVVLERAIQPWRIAARAQLHVDVARIMRGKATSRAFRACVLRSDAVGEEGNYFGSFYAGCRPSRDGWQIDYGRKQVCRRGCWTSVCRDELFKSGDTFTSGEMRDVAEDAVVAHFQYSARKLAEVLSETIRIDLRTADSGLMRVATPPCLWAFADIVFQEMYVNRMDALHYCPRCYKAFKPLRSDAVYCSDTCRSNARHDRVRNGVGV